MENAFFCENKNILLKYTLFDLCGKNIISHIATIVNIFVFEKRIERSPKMLKIVFILWNLIVFLLYGRDKQRAEAYEWRISEKTLLLCAFFLGGLGAGLGMIVFRHKTRQLKFRILVPVAIICNGAVLYQLISSSH